MFAFQDQKHFKGTFMIIADTHIHFYPSYDTSTAFNHLIDNLHKLNPSATKAAFLTERKECCFFSDLRDDRIPLSDAIKVKETPEPDALLITHADKPPIYLFAGRQIATAERLEILSLTSDCMIDDDLPARDIIHETETIGAIPVLAWALGKWTGRRNSKVANLIRSYSSQKLLIGDSSMRPSFFPQPSLINEAIAKGTTIIAGSDPLPFKGDDKYMGTYATLIDASIDETAPVTSMRRILHSNSKIFTRTGSRCNPLTVITRQLKM